MDSFACGFGTRSRVEVKASKTVRVCYSIFHDRFLILDGKFVYHIGASLKDAGKKCFGITLMKDAGPELMKKLEKIK